MNDKKIKEEVENYIENIFRVCFFDCCDSGEDAERSKNRFDGLVDDSISIEDYIRQNLLGFYTKEYKKVIKQYRISNDLKLKDMDESCLNGPVMTIPILREELDL